MSWIVEGVAMVSIFIIEDVLIYIVDTGLRRERSCLSFLTSSFKCISRIREHHDRRNRVKLHAINQQSGAHMSAMRIYSSVSAGTYLIV